MNTRPTPQTYEKELQYVPWGKLIETITNLIIGKAPKRAKLIDLMCGTGHLLRKVTRERPDLNTMGIDIDEKFLAFAKKASPHSTFLRTDVMKFKSSDKYDVAVCTAGLHHIPYSKQELFIERIEGLLKPSGFCIIADPYIDDYSNEEERKLAATKLGYEYLIVTIKNSAPKEVIKAVIELLYNDVMRVEYKTSLKKIKPIIKKAFSSVEIRKTWPDCKSKYGEYIIIAKNK